MRTRWSFLPLILLISGCASVAQYHSDYIAPQLSNMPATIPGKALVVTNPVYDEKPYTFHPSSLTGSASTFEIKLGRFLREITLSVFSKRFEEGAEHAAEVPTTSSYAIVVTPEILDFDYRYNQLKNLGFAVTPEVKIELYARFYDATGKKLFEKKYASEYRSGGSYVMSLNPPERINHSTHTTLTELAVLIANDAGAYISSIKTDK